MPNAGAARAGDVPEWHVSINDVPIGPIRLEEMGHKIDAGAVSEYSLVWRDGFDEWRPLATVPELMSMLHERRHAGLPSRSSFSSMPPFVETRVSLSEPAPLAAMPTSQSSFPRVSRIDDEDEIGPLADALQPEFPDSGISVMSQPPAPIGPEGVFDSSPQLGSYSGLPPKPDEKVAIPSVPPEQAASSAEPTSRLSLGILALIIAVAVFSAVAAYLAFDRFGDDLMQRWVGAKEPARSAVRASKPPKAARAEAARVEPAADPGPTGAEATASEAEGEVPEPALQDAPEPDVAAVALEEQADGSSEPLVPPPDPRDDAPKIAPIAKPKPRAPRAVRPAPVATPSAKPEPESDLDASEQKLLDEFGSGAGAAPAKIDVKQSGTSQSQNPPLDGAGVRATVTANKPRLQRCYERAIRGQQSPPPVRLDISVMVSSSGRVKSVSSEGSGPGGLAACVEASVRRWRFPASAEGGPAKFPVVFSAN